MAQLSQVLTQRIWGAYNPSTGLLVGIQTSGEAPYQAISASQIVTNYAGVRLTSHVNTQMVTTMGKVTQGDGGGTTFVYNPADTTSGFIGIGSASGTVLNITSVISGTVVIGQFPASSVTGVTYGPSIASFGTGAGGTGTYNLSAPISQPGPFTFLIDNNNTILVSTDSSRWYQNSTSPVITSLVGPITVTTTPNNPAFSITGNGTGPVLQLTTSSTGSGVAVATGASTQAAFAASGNAGVSLAALSFQETGQASWTIYEPAASSDFRVNASGTDRLILTSAGSMTLPTGTLTLTTGGASFNGNTSVSGGTFTTRGFTDNSTSTILTLASTGATFTGETAISGTATNDNAAAGYVGEIVTVTGSSTSLTTATPAGLTGASLSLTAGDWDVYATVTFQSAATTNVTLFAYGSATTSGALLAIPQSVQTLFQNAVVGAGSTVWTSPVFRYSLATTTTIFCNAQANFTVSTMNATGYLRARRVR